MSISANNEIYMANPVSLKKRCKSIIRLPAFLLRLLGRIYARKGKGCCDSFIDRYLHRCTAVEHAMCREIEDSLRKIRTDSAAAELYEPHEMPEAAPEHMTNDDPVAIRAARAEANRKENDRASAKARRERLVAINETIISEEDKLFQSIGHIRAHTAAKLSAFITGVRRCRKNNLAEYRSGETPLSFDGSAFDDYKQAHEANDSARLTLLACLKGGA